jgi:hypothetical protein
MKKIRSLICILLALMMSFTVVACGGGSTASEETPSAGAPSAGAPSEGASSAGSSGGTGGVATQSLDDYVAYTVGVSGWLGRFIQGLSPTECWLACDGVYDAVFKLDQRRKRS